MLRACPQLNSLVLQCYDLSMLMPLLSTAIILTTLTYLDLSYCNISDPNLLHLGRRIRFSQLLHNLNICGNPFTHEGLHNFLKLFMNNPYSRLAFLGLHQLLNREERETMQAINQFRDKLGYIHLIQNPALILPEFLLEATTAIKLAQLRKQKDGN